MTEKRFTHDGIVIGDHLKKDLIYIDGDENLLDLAEYVDRLQSENEQLKLDLKVANDGADLYKDINEALEKENEQLKQQIEDLEFKLRTIGAYDRTANDEYSDSVYDFKKKLKKW